MLTIDKTDGSRFVSPTFPGIASICSGCLLRDSMLLGGHFRKLYRLSAIELLLNEILANFIRILLRRRASWRFLSYRKLDRAGITPPLEL